jgi:hypothetical protein
MGLLLSSLISDVVPPSRSQALIVAAVRRRRSEGSPPSGATHRAARLYSVDRCRIWTMMQPCASAARLRATGPFFTSALTAMLHPGVTVTSDRHQRSVAMRRIVKPFVRVPLRPVASRGRTQSDAFGHLTGRNEAPQCDQQFAGQGHDHGLACATAGVCGPRPVPSREATVGLEPKETPSQFDHAVAHSRAAGLGEPLLPPPGATLVRRAR